MSANFSTQASSGDLRKVLTPVTSAPTRRAANQARIQSGELPHEQADPGALADARRKQPQGQLAGFLFSLPVGERAARIAGQHPVAVLLAQVLEQGRQGGRWDGELP